MHVLFNHNLSCNNPNILFFYHPPTPTLSPPPTTASPPLTTAIAAAAIIKCQEFFKENSTIASQLSNAFPQFSPFLLKKQRKKKQRQKTSKLSTLFSTFPVLIPPPLLNLSRIPPSQLPKKKITIMTLSVLWKIPIIPIQIQFQISQMSSLRSDSSSLPLETPTP